MSGEEQFASWPVSPSLVSRVETSIRNFRASDPFLPIHVLVPNHVLGTLLARALFADTGYLAIHVELPYEFAWSVAARDSLGAGLLPVPEEVDLAIVLNAAAGAVAEVSTPDYLKRAVEMPGFAPAALRTLRDIAAADVGSAALEAFATKAPDADKVRVLARIAHGHQKTLASAQLIDRENAVPAGGGIVADDGRCRRCVRRRHPGVAGTRSASESSCNDSPVCLACLSTRTGIAPRRDAARKAFVGRAGIAFEPLEGELQGGTSLSRVQGSLFEENAQDRPAPLDSSVRFLSAPGESLEAWKSRGSCSKRRCAASGSRTWPC